MADTEKATLEVRIDELYAELGRTQLDCDMWHDRAEDMRNRLSVAQAENAKLREYATEAWGLFVKHGTIRPCDLQEVVGVRDGLRALGIGADE
jgi:hypothetical protein